MQPFLEAWLHQVFVNCERRSFGVQTVLKLGFVIHQKLFNDTCRVFSLSLFLDEFGFVKKLCLDFRDTKLRYQLIELTYPFFAKYMSGHNTILKVCEEIVFFHGSNWRHHLCSYFTLKWQRFWFVSWLFFQFLQNHQWSITS